MTYYGQPAACGTYLSQYVNHGPMEPGATTLQWQRSTLLYGLLPGSSEGYNLQRAMTVEMMYYVMLT